MKVSTLAMDRSRIEVHVKPLIGSRVVAALTSDDTERLQADIVVGRTARVRSGGGRGGVARGGKGVATRTVGMLGTVLEPMLGSRKAIRWAPDPVPIGD